mmetsp:Transcript_3940/g.4548  ORF Transcript_3940/g.4548 Transcript_3940/m.4548 type:complete len:94 (-) Transcript_3940:530-811(-)
MAASLKEWKDLSVTVVTCDGRIIVGKLTGHDQVQNLILSGAEERVYSMEETVELVPLGLYVIRGDNVALIGEATSWEDNLRADAIPTVFQNVI